MAGLTVKRLGFGDLTGWHDDDLRPALAAYAASCGRIVTPGWPDSLPCADHVSKKDLRAYFTRHFTPVICEDASASLITGYFEPVYAAAPQCQDAFRFPIYRLPADHPPGWKNLSRAQIDAGALGGLGLEIAWLCDPWDVFFLQVQGSGRLQMPDGSCLRVGFAGKTSAAYVSVGQRLIATGQIPAAEISARAIRDWAADQPDAGAAIMQENPSYGFFQPLAGLADNEGPLGTLQVPLVAGRSLAVDPQAIPLGAPVWLERPDAPGRLMVAHDTGSAIKGAQRADIFCGTGAAAGATAGALNTTGRLIMLLPHAQAEALL